MRRVGVIVVHGVGEQRRFELLEAIASNLYRALRHDRTRSGAYIDLRRSGAAERGGNVDSAWRLPPAVVGWRAPDGTQMEVVLREVYWADLDLPDSWGGSFKLWGWALGIAGVRFYTDAGVGPARDHEMCEPAFPLKGWQRIKVRAQLFLAALVFFYLIISVFLLNWVFVRRLPLSNRFRRVVNSYLGDVKLYQDWQLRRDERLEVICRKSRVAIRARMIRTLLETAAQTLSRDRAERLDSYYVVSHSLGTVAAFNGLMETELALPNYLSREEWQALPRRLKRRAHLPAPPGQMPERPPWLTPRDAIDRTRLFERLEGFVTLGSPLDKFATLWPCIVRVNAQGLRARGRVPWINVTDVQDIVGAPIDLLRACPPASGIGGLDKTEVNWADQWTLASAHTSYWKARRRISHPVRLIERLVPWLEGGAFTPPPNRMPVWLARLIYWFSLIALPALILFGFVTLAWAIANDPLPFSVSFSDFLAGATRWAVLGGVAIVTVFSVARAIWERVKLGWEV